MIDMATFKVTAPAAGYDGKVGKVQFRDGVAEIDSDRNPMELAYCRNAGYLIEEAEGAPDGSESFDPTERDMPAVLAYLKDADHAEAERVLDAEAAAAKPRKGIVDQRDAILDSKKEEEK